MTTTVPTIAVNSTSVEEVYATTNQLTAMSIDADQKVLYVSEAAPGEIRAIYYKDELSTETMYDDIQNVSSLAADYSGNIYWSVSEGGKDEGAITRAKADLADHNSLTMITEAVDSAAALCYKLEFLFFAGEDQNDGGNASSSENSAIYYKHVPSDGEVSSEVKKISNAFENVVSIGTFDNSFLYIADAAKGFFAIEVMPDDEFSEPRPIELTVNEQNAPKPTAMVIFTLNAVWGYSAAVWTASIAIAALVLI